MNDATAKFKYMTSYPFYCRPRPINCQTNFVRMRQEMRLRGQALFK